MESGLSITLVLVYIGLAIFGVLYAIVVWKLVVSEMTEGFSSLMVVFGVLGTLAGVYIIEYITGNITTLQVLGAFICSGSPMIGGDVGAYLLRKSNGRKLWQDLDRRLGNDTTQGVAQRRERG